MRFLNLARFSGIATLPLSLGVLIGLIRELIFELYAHNGNAIEVEVVDGLVPVAERSELPDAARHAFCHIEQRSSFKEFSGAK